MKAFLSTILQWKKKMKAFLKEILYIVVVQLLSPV